MKDILSIPPPTRRILLMRFHIDTNRINSRSKEKSMNKLEKWCEDGVIEIGLSDTALKEMGESDGKRYNKAIKGLIAGSSKEEEISTEEFNKAAKIIFPNGMKTPNDENDVKIVLYAKHYKCILITDDGASKNQPRGILGSAQDLKDKLDVTVLRDHEAVTLVKKHIQERDEYAMEYSKETGKPLPSWVGKD